MRVQPEALDQLGASRSIDAAPHPGQQVDDLAAGQGWPQRDIAGHIGDLTVQGDGIGPRVASQYPHRPAVTAGQAEQDPDGGGLAGTIGAEEAVHLTLAHGHVESVQRLRAAESFTQALDFDRIHVSAPFRRARKASYITESVSRPWV